MIKEYKIVIPSYRRAKVLEDRTLQVLRNHNIPKEKIFIFVGNKDEEKRYKETLSPYYNRIVVGEVGMKEIRNFITNYFDDGEYLMCFDDDLKNFEELLIEKEKDKPFSRSTHSRKLKDLDKFITDGFNELERTGFQMFGVYPASNPFFMKKTITHRLEFCVGSCWGKINDKSLTLSIDNKEDFERTLLSYKKYGGVVRFNYISPITNYYTLAGGMNDDRTYEDDLKSCNYLIKTFPQYVKMARTRKSGMPMIKVIKQ
jgi:hypothetical protein